MLQVMTSPEQFEIYNAMLTSRAVPLRTTTAGGGTTHGKNSADGAWLVHWRNADTETEYHQPHSHTLSLYLRGGESVRCVTEPDARGAAGSLCCMPAGHTSRWDVRGSLELMHLYLPRLQLAHVAERWFDLDPRHAALADRIYFEDPVLAHLGGQLAALHWQHPDAPLQIQHLVMQLQAQLLLAHCGIRRAVAHKGPRGGLSATARRRVLDCVESAIGGAQPALADLAAAACLSEFHFARMFKQSFGMAPHAWVMQRRLVKARTLLAQGRLAVVDVALQSGYAHTNHLNTALRRAGLGSASRYRDALVPLC